MLRARVLLCKMRVSELLFSLSCDNHGLLCCLVAELGGNHMSFESRVL